MNVVSNAPEYDKKTSWSQKKINNNNKKKCHQLSKFYQPFTQKSLQKKKKNVLCLQNFLVGQKSVKTRSSTAIVHPGAVATPPE